MAMPIGKLRGMSYPLEIKLKAAGIYNSRQLLQVARTPDGREALAGQLDLDTRRILELAKRADLARVRGIGGVFSDLLEHVGVETVADLADCPPIELRADMLAANGRKKLAGRLPTLRAVEDWVFQATELPKLLEL
jgi:nucleotidyltransferase/DNA polymerase involved in DNA repair